MYKLTHVCYQRGKQQEEEKQTTEADLRMKVYFCGSIRGGRDDVHLYRRIVHKLQNYGTVLTEHVSSSELTDRGQRSPSNSVIR